MKWKIAFVTQVGNPLTDCLLVMIYTLFLKNYRCLTKHLLIGVLIYTPLLFVFQDGIVSKCQCWSLFLKKLGSNASPNIFDIPPPPHQWSLQHYWNTTPLCHVMMSNDALTKLCCWMDSHTPCGGGRNVTSVLFLFHSRMLYSKRGRVIPFQCNGSADPFYEEWKVSLGSNAWNIFEFTKMRPAQNLSY